MTAHFVFYVLDQAKSVQFYRSVLGVEPSLDVPGMSQFALTSGALLGLMPATGIARLLGESIEVPTQTNVARAELYLEVDDALAFHRRALKNGATELSPFEQRDWGDTVAYCQDLDGYILAFAQKTVPTQT